MTAGDPPRPGWPLGGGFSLTYAPMENIARRWGETAEVIDGAAERLTAGGDWSRPVADAVTAFVSSWQGDLAQASAGALDVRRRLQDNVAAYRKADVDVVFHLDRGAP